MAATGVQPVQGKLLLVGGIHARDCGGFAAGGAVCYVICGRRCDVRSHPRLSPSPSSVERPSRLICAVPCDCAGMWMFERCYRQQADVLYKHELIIVTSGTFERKKGLSIQR